MGAGLSGRLPRFLLFFPLFSEEFVVDRLNRLLGVGLVQKHGYLDLTGGNHVDIDVRVIQGAKHLCGHAGVCLLYTSPSPRDTR